mgnify:CR=1 FL=1
MSKSKNINPILLIVIIVIVIIAIGVGVYFLVTSKENYTDSTGKYQICPGNDGKNRRNNSDITSKDECKKAKGDKTWAGKEDEPGYPTGCYTVGSQVWYNENAGAKKQSCRSICKKITSAATTTTSAVNVPLMKMSDQKIDCSGKICKLSSCPEKNCLTYEIELAFSKLLSKYISENRTCMLNATANKDTTPACKSKIEQFKAAVKILQDTGNIELNINKSLDGPFKETLNEFVVPKESFGKGLTAERINNDDYTENEANGRRSQILFTKLLALSQKLEDVNSVQQNGESVTKEPKRLLNYDEYLKLISEAYFGALRDADKLPTEKERKEQKRMLKKNVNNMFTYLKQKGVMQKVGLNMDLIKKLQTDIQKTLFGEVNANFGKTIETYIDYDSDGNLREYHSSQSQNYLITALAKAKLLSIGQVYQLRKVMLEAFKNESNHKFFHFYYSNFRGIADFLESTERLNEIVPDILEVVELSKQGEFQSAFERYISTARKAYQMCKDTGMDVSGIEQEWDALEEFKMNGLPEPNTLFVEEPFRKALRHFGTVC